MVFNFEVDDINEAAEELRGVYNYWEGLCGQRIAPTLKEFDLLEIPAPLLPHTIVVDYLSEEDTFKFRFYGTEAAHRHGEDLTGKSPADFKWSPFGEALEKEYRKFLKKKKPEYLTLGFTNEEGTEELHKILRLPLSEDGLSVSGFVAILLASLDREETQKFFEKIADSK